MIIDTFALIYAITFFFIVGGCVYHMIGDLKI